jgi:hypothetical protein
VSILQRQAALRGILRRQRPLALRAMLRQSVTWVQQPAAAGNADVSCTRQESRAWLRRASDLPEHELRQRRQVQHGPRALHACNMPYCQQAMHCRAAGSLH